MRLSYICIKLLTFSIHFSNVKSNTFNFADNISKMTYSMYVIMLMILIN